MYFFYIKNSYLKKKKKKITIDFIFVRVSKCPIQTIPSSAQSPSSRERGVRALFFCRLFLSLALLLAVAKAPKQSHSCAPPTSSELLSHSVLQVNKQQTNKQTLKQNLKDQTACVVSYPCNSFHLLTKASVQV
jgi:hypothetical protein